MDTPAFTKYDNPFGVENAYKMANIQEAFPNASKERLLSLYDLNLENIDKYGVSMSLNRVYLSASTIDSIASEFPDFSNDEGLKTEYIHSAYTFIAVLHNLHKITSRLIFTANLNKLYAMILDANLEDSHVGYSVLQIEESEIKTMTRNAMLICKNLNTVAKENDYLEIILAMLEHHSLSKQWILFTHTNYDNILDYQNIPTEWLKKVFDIN